VSLPTTEEREEERGGINQIDVAIAINGVGETEIAVIVEAVVDPLEIETIKDEEPLPRTHQHRHQANMALKPLKRLQ
jgi:hypothetical protein